MKILLFVLGATMSGLVSASCVDGGESCVLDIYSSEKQSRMSRTAAGALLDSDLPNSNAIERNVDFTSYATKSSLSAEIRRLEDIINAGLHSNNQNMLNHIDWLNQRITNLESRTSGLESQGSGGGFSSVQDICSNCEFTASSDGMLIIYGSGGRSYINVWDPNARGLWGRPGGAWVSRCLSASSADGATSSCTGPIRKGEKVRIGASHGYGSQAVGKFYKY